MHQYHPHYHHHHHHHHNHPIHIITITTPIHITIIYTPIPIITILITIITTTPLPLSFLPKPSTFIIINTIITINSYHRHVFINLLKNFQYNYKTTMIKQKTCDSIMGLTTSYHKFFQFEMLFESHLHKSVEAQMKKLFSDI